MILVVIMIICMSFLFAGCIPPNQPIIQYEQYGLKAYEWAQFGRKEIHLLEFNLSNNAITSIVCNVDGIEYVACDKQNPERVSPIYAYDDIVSEDGFIASNISSQFLPQEGGRIVSINVCESNKVIRVRLNDIELFVPCKESDLINALGNENKKYKILLL